MVVAFTFIPAWHVVVLVNNAIRGNVVVVLQPFNRSVSRFFGRNRHAIQTDTALIVSFLFVSYISISLIPIENTDIFRDKAAGNRKANAVVFGVYHGRAACASAAIGGI